MVRNEESRIPENVPAHHHANATHCLTPKPDKWALHTDKTRGPGANDCIIKNESIIDAKCLEC